MQSRHSQSEIAADVNDFSVLNAAVVVSSINQYSDLHSKVISSNTFEPIFCVQHFVRTFCKQFPSNEWQRY